MSDFNFEQERNNEYSIQEAKQSFLQMQDVDTLIELLDTLMSVPYYMAWDEADADSGFLRLTIYGTTYIPVLIPDGDAVGLAVFSSIARASEDFQTEYELFSDEDPTFLFEIFRSAKARLHKEINILIDPFDEGSVRITEDMLQVYPLFREVMGQEGTHRVKRQVCPECGEIIETYAYSKFVVCKSCGNKLPNTFPSAALWSGRSDPRVNGWRVCPVCRGDGSMIHRKYGKDWNCLWCGYKLSNKAWEDIVLWFCDSCDTYMNIQPGFATESGRWVCTVCGQENDVSDDNIEEDYEEPPRLETPVGEIFILLDGKAIPYVAKKGEPLDVLCPDVLGRYQIDIVFKPDGREHTITCFPAGKVITDTDVQTGERLESMAFYSEDRYKLSIGIECESGYIGGQRVNDDYDFDVEYTSASIEIKIYPTTKTETYTIGIAWIDDVGLYDDGGERDVQTWFGADPTLCLANNNEENKHG